jgi:phosphoglycerate dehydrogenase-like enzyme
LILITIDELQGDKRNQIEEITGGKAYLMYLDDNIPYDEIEIMISYGLKEDWATLDEMPNLKWIQIFQTGIEHVPLDRINERNIALTNVRNIYGTPISEYVMSLILYETREINRFIENKKVKRYDREKLVDELGQKTIGIFGTGAVGKEVAKKAQAFDMNVSGFNTSGSPVEYFDETYTWDHRDELIRKCDFIILLLPLIDETYHFLSDKEFQMMKDNAYVINIGRGPLIKEEALLNALKYGEIKGAALDVFYEEPLPASSLLWEAENLILTPHLSGKTQYFFDRSIAIFKDNHKAYINNNPMLFEIDFVKGY